MTEEEHAFLQAIKDSPDDDTPRLVFADWLEERGNPRGEFIRIQCALARLSDDDPHRAALQTRERELLELHKKAWLANVPYSDYRFEEHWFERGLIHLTTSLWNFVHWMAGQGVEAWLEGLDLKQRGPIHDEYDCRGHCSHDRAKRQCARALAAWPGLAHVTSLGLARNEIGRKGVAALAASPHLTRLTRLNLECNSIGDKGAAALAVSRRLGRLTHLNLTFNGITDKGVAALAASPNLAGLTCLDLSDNDIGNEGWEALAGSPYLTGLTSVILDDTRIGRRAGRALRKRFGRPARG